MSCPKSTAVVEEVDPLQAETLTTVCVNRETEFSFASPVISDIAIRQENILPRYMRREHYSLARLVATCLIPGRSRGPSEQRIIWSVWVATRD